MGVGWQDENGKRKPKPLSNRNDGATWNNGPSAWDSYFITYAYESYEVYNTVSNISNVRLDLCAWHGSDHLGHIPTSMLYGCQLLFEYISKGTIFHVGGAPRNGVQQRCIHGICLLVFLILIRRYIFRSIASPKYKAFGRHMYSRKTQWAYAIWWGWL